MRSKKATDISAGQAVLLTALILILFFTGIWAWMAWNAGSGVAMGVHGWIALGFGTFFSLVIGCGLMALMFFSSRSGYDEVADPFRPKSPEHDDPD